MNIVSMLEEPRDIDGEEQQQRGEEIIFEFIVEVLVEHLMYGDEEREKTEGPWISKAE